MQANPVPRALVPAARVRRPRREYQIAFELAAHETRQRLVVVGCWVDFEDPRHQFTPHDRHTTCTIARATTGHMLGCIQLIWITATGSPLSRFMEISFM
jgi:hypothetical protein